MRQRPARTWTETPEIGHVFDAVYEWTTADPRDLLRLLALHTADPFWATLHSIEHIVPRLPEPCRTE